MATKVHHLIQPLPGTKDLYTLLDVIRNADKYEAALAALEAARKQANDMIERIAPATEIESLRAEAERVLTDAKHVMEDANGRAKTILETAEQKAAAIDADLERSREALAKRVRDFEESCAARESAFQLRENELNKRSKELAEREKEAAQTLARAKELQAFYEQKIEAINRLSAALK